MSTGAAGPFAQRLAVAPISWGVCEVPGWGTQLSCERVLGEMRGLGITATEFGPDGFLPESPSQKAAVLSDHGMHAVGGFIPLVMHDPEVDVLPVVRAAIVAFLAAGATRMVLAADTGQVGYDSRPDLDETQWDRLLATLDSVDALCADQGIVAAIHPHVGTMVESAADIARVLAGSCTGICLDTGHFLVGGSDPVAFAVEHTERISHVHLKDVRISLAEEVRSGDLTYTEAVASGMYVPLGSGDIDIWTIITRLEGSGYSGYYVLEQDVVLHDEPAVGTGPVQDVRASLSFLTSRPTPSRGRAPAVQQTTPPTARRNTQEDLR